LAFAQRALAAAAILARAAAENLRFAFLLPAGCLRFLAQRARWAAAILARVAADLRLLPRPLLAPARDEEPI